MMLKNNYIINSNLNHLILIERSPRQMHGILTIAYRREESFVHVMTLKYNYIINLNLNHLILIER